MGMNVHIDNFVATSVEKFQVQAVYTGEGVTLRCKDLAGNLVASRSLTRKQLDNPQITSLVLADLKTTLHVLAKQPAIFPLPEWIQPQNVAP